VKRLVPGLFVLSLSLAGGTAASAAETTIELAQLATGGARLAVNIESRCMGSDPYFRVVNEGAEWPRVVRLELVNTTENRIVMKRSMRMKPKQIASFRLPANQLGKGEYGLRLKPSWYDRKVDYDARLDCK